MNKNKSFQNLSITAVCLLTLSLIFVFLYQGYDESILNTISKVFLGLALILQIITLFIKKQNKNTSSIVKTKDKIYYILAIVFLILLFIVVAVMLAYFFYMQ